MLLCRTMSRREQIVSKHGEERISRKAVADARRIVVKVGSRVLVQKSGRPNMPRIHSLVKEMLSLQRSGREVVFVTSGAIGAGMEILGMKRRPARLPDLQMAAAVGQNRLMTRYEKLFAAGRRAIGQVLLTHDDLKNRARHLNARNTMLNMLRNGIVPIVNENDVVAVDEIKFGDNDLLASLVAHLIDADLLVLLTAADGLRERLASGRSRRVPRVEAVTQDIMRMAEDKEGGISTGGMVGKLHAARAAAEAGVCVVIADGRRPRIIEQVMKGADTGTLVAPSAGQSLPGRKRWIAYFHKCCGMLIIDDGASRAIVEQGKSLLPVGIRDVEGNFGVGAVVEIAAGDRVVIARGLVSYSSGDIRTIRGRRTSEIAGLLGTEGYDEVVHRDNMVLLSDGV